jgi:hypothetical protein
MEVEADVTKIVGRIPRHLPTSASSLSSSSSSSKKEVAAEA